MLYGRRAGHFEGEIHGIALIFERFLERPGNNDCRTASIDVGSGIFVYF